MEIHKFLKIKMIFYIKLFIKINYKNFNIFDIYILLLIIKQH